MVKTEKALIDVLRRCVQQQFGRAPLNSADAEELAETIRRKTKSTLSSQTVRRFFGLVKCDGNFRQHNLNCFAQYCGYESFQDFREKRQDDELAQLYQNAESSPEDYWELSDELSQKIADDPALLVETHHRLMALPMAREFFMEHHPNRDLLCTVYSQYFINYLKFKHDNEARLFAYAFLFLGAYLTENEEFMEIYFGKIKSTDATPEIHVIPAANKYGVALLFADSINDEKLFAETWQEMLDARKKFRKKSKCSVASFEYTVLEFLIFTHRTDEMRWLIENNTPQSKADCAFIPESRSASHRAVWEILCSAAWLKIGDRKRSRQHIEKADRQKLGIGWQKYYGLLYCYAARAFADDLQRQKIGSEISALRDEMKISRLINFPD